MKHITKLELHVVELFYLAIVIPELYNSESRKETTENWSVYGNSLTYND